MTKSTGKSSTTSAEMQKQHKYSQLRWKGGRKAKRGPKPRVKDKLDWSRSRRISSKHRCQKAPITQSATHMATEPTTESQYSTIKQ